MKTFNQIANLNPRRLMIVDGLNLGFRWMHSGAAQFVADYIETVKSLQRSYNCGKVLILSDIGSSKYRKDLYPEYKGNRTKKYEEQTEEEAKKFERFFKEYEATLVAIEDKHHDMPVIRFPKVEADDLAAYICSQRRKYKVDEIWLISSDADWNQLISEDISQFSYVTRKELTVDNWEEKYDHSVEDLISIKVLMGDSGDNVMGVAGIGPKKALALVQEYGSAMDIIDALPIPSKYKHIQNLNAFGAENLMLNYKLMDLPSFCKEGVLEENIPVVNAILDNYLEKK